MRLDKHVNDQNLLHNILQSRPASAGRVLIDNDYLLWQVWQRALAELDNLKNEPFTPLCGLWHEAH